jgi:hypothetical protein
MTYLVKILVIISAIRLLAHGQETGDLGLARSLANLDTQQQAVGKLLASGRDKVPLLLSWTKAAPPQLNDLEVAVLGDALADIFGELKTDEAIPYLIKNIGHQRFPPTSGVVWTKPLSVIEKQEPAMAALVKIGPTGAVAIIRASPWNMGPEERMAAIIAVSEIADGMKDPTEERMFLKGMLAQANNERVWAEQCLKRLEGRGGLGR